MTIKQLIEQLQTVDPEEEVLLLTFDAKKYSGHASHIITGLRSESVFTEEFSKPNKRTYLMGREED